MKLVIQRVLEAKVMIDGQCYSEIGHGLLILLGIQKKDDTSPIHWLINKLIHLRIFGDEEGKMNRSLKQIDGQILVVSQFTLYGNCLNGRRPDFIQAAAPLVAEPLYQQFVEELKKEIKHVRTGVFGANMQMSLINDGPVTCILEKEVASVQPLREKSIIQQVY